MKSKNYTHRNKDKMLTCRFPAELLKLINKVSSRIGMTRSEYIRSVIQKDIDTSPQSYKV